MSHSQLLKEPMPSSLRLHIEKLKTLGVCLEQGMYLAGGAVRRAICGHDISKGDFDIYVTRPFYPRPLLHWKLISRVEKPTINIETYTFEIDSYRVQYHCTKESIVKMLHQFDFTCCQLACDGYDILYLKDALEDAKRMKLKYTGVRYNMSSTLRRCFRFVEMGFKPTISTLISMDLAAKQRAEHRISKIEEASMFGPLAAGPTSSYT